MMRCPRLNCHGEKTDVLGVEPSLNATQRTEVKKRFADSRVTLGVLPFWGIRR
jgi:hypothetical protein